jgi:hypothetical protein
MKIFEKEVFRLLGLLVKDLYYEARFESVTDVKQIVELLKDYTRSLEAHITHAEKGRNAYEETEE